MNCLVIGGTGFIGRLLVAELLKQDHSVTVLHRRPKHDLGRRVQNIAADRNDAAALKAALAGKKFDTVFDNVYDWERGTTAAHVEGAVRAAGSNLHRYVFMSSVAAAWRQPDTLAMKAMRSRPMTRRNCTRAIRP